VKPHQKHLVCREANSNIHTIFSQMASPLGSATRDRHLRSFFCCSLSFEGFFPKKKRAHGHTLSHTLSRALTHSTTLSLSVSPSCSLSLFSRARSLSLPQKSAAGAQRGTEGCIHAYARATSKRELSCTNSKCRRRRTRGRGRDTRTYTVTDT